MDRVIDYRSTAFDDTPERCPECGAPVTREPTYGEMYVGSADLERLSYLKDCGITTVGPAKTIWWTWHCSAHPDEHPCGPTLGA